MKKTLLSLLILLSSSSALANADEGHKTFNIVKTAAYHGAFAAPVAIGAYRYLNSDNILKNNFTKIEDAKIVSLVQDACSKVTDTKVNIYTGDASSFGIPDGYLAAAIGGKDIIIEPSYYQVIKEYISDETKENRDVVLNIFNFIMQHEAGHFKNKDNKHRMQRVIAIYLIKACLFEVSKKAFDFEASQLLTHLSLNIIDMLLQSCMIRQEEYRADTGVVGQDTLKGGNQFFTNLINLGKSNPAIYWTMKFDLTHPTPDNRLKRLQELEQTAQ